MNSFIFRLLTRTQTVDDVLRVISKTQRKLVKLSNDLYAAAAKEEAEAEKRLAKARVNREESERAARVFGKLNSLTA